MSDGEGNTKDYNEEEQNLSFYVMRNGGLCEQKTPRSLWENSKVVLFPAL